MNTNNGALYFSAAIDLTEWRRNLDTMRRDISGLRQSTESQTKQIDSSFKNLSIGIASYFSASALKSFVMEMVNIRGEFQKTEIAFTTMLRDAGKANALMGDMVQLAAKTPFSLQDVSSGAKQLLAFQVPANEVVDTLTRMGNIAAGLSIPLSRINLVYGQVRAKGKLMGDDLRQFTEAGIPMVAELAKKFNTTTGAITEMVSAGKIGFKDVQDVLFAMTNEGGMFFNLMEKQSKSVTGQISNMGDTWDQALNKIGQSQEGIINDSIQGLTYLIEHYQDVIKVIITLVETYGAYRAALIVTSATQGKIVAPAIIQGFSNLIKVIRGATVAQTALNSASLANPYVLLATLIAGLIAVTYNYRYELGELLGIIKEQTSAQKAQQAVTEEYNSSFGKGVAETKASISQLISIIRNESSTLDQRKQAYERLIAIDSTFRGALDAQYKATYRLGDAFTYVIGKIDAFAMAQAKASASKKFLEASFEEQFKAGALKTQVLDADAEMKKYQKLDAEARKAGKASLDYMRKASDAESKRNKLAEDWRKQQDLANEKTSISNTIVRNNNTEIAQKQKQISLLEKEIKVGNLTADALEKRKKQVEKLKYELTGFYPQEIASESTSASKKGWAQQIKDQIEALEAEAESAGTRAAYLRIQEKIKKLQELLNPKKEKTDNKQLADILPIGSIKELQRRVSLLQEAIDTAVNGQVKLRKLDKYGKDTDKSGNPYLTGEIISPDEARKRLESINDEIKKMQGRNFDEEMSELERQWKIRYQLTKYYGDETAKAMFPNLKGDSYYSEVNNLFKNLDEKNKSGVILTDQELTNWSKLQGILSELNGTKDPFTQFTEGIDEDLSKLKTAAEKVEYLNGRLYKLNDQEIASWFKAEIFNQLNSIKLEEEKQYKQLLDDHQSFNDRKISIERDTAIAIRKIREDQNISEEKKKDLEGSIDKKSKEEISQLAIDELTQSKAWMSLYGNIDQLTDYQMEVLLKELEAKKGNLAKVLTTVDFSILLKNLKDVKNKIAEENPFMGLFNSLTDLFEVFGENAEVAGEQGYNAFEKASDGISGTLKAAKGIISTLEPAREYMSDTANDAIDTIDQVATMGMLMMEAIKGTVQAVKTALDKASWSNWITAIISIIYTVIKAIVSLFTWMAKRKTKKINSEIKAWQRAVDDLKNSYDELQRVIEKTAGESQLSMQRGLIQNLREQQRILEEMRNEESKKKKPDQDKIASYTKEIQDINTQIQQIVDDFKTSVTTIEFKDLSKNIADALIEAFGQGEDAAKAFDKVVDDVMRNAVANALKIRFLDDAAQKMVDKLYSSMGYSTTGATAEQSALLQNYKNLLADAEKNLASSSPIYSSIYQAQINNYKELIKKLEAEIASNAMNGSFDGLTEQEREEIKNLGINAMNQYIAALQQYEDLFGAASTNAQGLKGDIKGITEKTAGALEAQFNAMRINLVALLQIVKKNSIVHTAANALLSQIEINTRNLHQMRKDLSELNAKTKGKLAGI